MWLGIFATGGEWLTEGRDAAVGMESACRALLALMARAKLEQVGSGQRV